MVTTKMFSEMFFVFIGCLLLASTSSAIDSEEGAEDPVVFHPAHCHHLLGANDTFPIVSFQWEEVRTPYTIVLWVLLAGVARILFSFSPFHEYVPESCVLILIGLGVGAIVFFVPNMIAIKLESELFFLYLLPPIMLDAGYFMPIRAFNNNLPTILMFAVVGTLFNAVTIGLSLFAVSELGWFGYDESLNQTISISILECFTFSSLISAIDPVAVIAVFEEINVNQVLFVLVLGESLLNDAVTVVLYRMFKSFNEIGEENIDPLDVVFGVISFFVVSFGGVVVGALFGWATALITRFTHHTRIIAPVFIFLMSYMAYLTAEMLSLSSILSIVTCAMVMKQYVEKNISQKSHTTVKYSIKLLSSLSETIIFILLGIATLTESHLHAWNTAFVLFTLLFTFAYRFVGVLWQCALVNRFRLWKIASKDQFIMGYGGIRGAIAFSLAALLCANVVHANKIFFTTTIVVVMFTMFIQGISVKPIVNKLRVKKQEKRKRTMNEEIFIRVNDHILAGMELLLGQGGQYYFRERWKYFDQKYLKKFLIRDYTRVHHPKIIYVYQKLTEKDAKDHIAQHGKFHTSPSLSSMLRRTSTSASSLSNSNLPAGEGDICLDMNATFANGYGIPERHASISRHMDTFVQSMYRPATEVHPDDLTEPTEDPLMYRSMQIQIDYRNNMKRRKRRQKRYRKSSRDSERVAADDTPASPPIDEGITFVAPEYSSDATSGPLPGLQSRRARPSSEARKKYVTAQGPAHVIRASEGADWDDGRHDSPVSIQESIVPWRRDSDLVGSPSQRASEPPRIEPGTNMALSNLGYLEEDGGSRLIPNGRLNNGDMRVFAKRYESSQHLEDIKEDDTADVALEMHSHDEAENVVKQVHEDTEL